MEDEPIMLVMIIINVMRVIMRLCSPLPAAPVKFDNRIAMARLKRAIKNRVKKVDRIFLNIIF